LRPPDPARELERLRAAWLRVEALLARPDDDLLVRVERSAWTRAQHLYHVALASEEMLRIAENLAHSRTASPHGGPTLVGRLVRIAGRIPRGAGRAPLRTIPPEVFERAELERAVTAIGAVIARLEGLIPALRTARGRARHRGFGKLTAAEWVFYVRVHVEHHLRLCR
jgi:hypothetical protein